MKEEIFRKKSLDRMKGPESLNDYICVSSPGVWLILGAIIALLIGGCIWGAFGRIETTVKITASVQGGEIVGKVSSAEVKENMVLKIEKKKYVIEKVDKQFENGEVICCISAKTDLPDGEYDAEIVIESIAPFSFVFN